MNFKIAPSGAIYFMFALLLTGNVAEWNKEREAHPDELLSFHDLEASLQGKNLAGINLHGVVCGAFDLRHCDLRNADLANADLCRVCLSLETTDLEGANVDEVTWPFNMVEAVAAMKRLHRKG